jgi:ferredoxin/nitrate reductase gamma subunit
MIFYGFITLWIATEFVAIHFDTPFKVFHGPVYIVVSFLADIGGLFILLGLGLAYYRRYVKKPDFLAATKPNNEKFMYGMLLALVLGGFALEGIRIFGTGMPEGEAKWSPVGWFIASIFSGFGLSDDTWAMTYKGLWFFHMVNTMAFIASIGHTKFFHIIALPINALLTPAHRGGVLNPMDFNNENAETFGLGKSSELTMKERLDTEACVECGRCTQVCPANQADKPLNPKTIVTKMRDVLEANPGQEISLWDETNPIYASNELDSCTTCGARLMSIKNTEFIKIVDAAKKERQKVAFAEVRSSKEYIEYQNAITAMEGKGLTPVQRMEILHPLHDKVVSLSRDLQLKYDVEIPRYL